MPDVIKVLMRSGEKAAGSRIVIGMIHGFGLVTELG